MMIIKKVLNKVKKEINQFHSYDYPEQSGGWIKYQNNPILGNEESGSLFDPFVRKVEDKFIMCVSKRNTHSLLLFDSLDGIHWENEREILTGIVESEWEEKINRGCFLKYNNQWYLWYTGQSGEKSEIGLAISRDGTKFERVSENSVLKPIYKHEGVSVMNPCVYRDEEKDIFRMWYAAGENYEPDVICYAESYDGMKWKQREQPIMCAGEEEFQKSKIGACDVIKDNAGYYLMGYIAYQNVNVARICLAKSSNGIEDWHLIGDKPILSPGKDKWDSHAVYKPTIYLDIEKQKTLLWYNGRKKHSEKIGMAFINKCV